MINFSFGQSPPSDESGQIEGCLLIIDYHKLLSIISYEENLVLNFILLSLHGIAFFGEN
uniref:Uncharacterized protein n=1 Tax=Gloeothece verrucosa (strain PCC 7822) TaxID=497965 RepID=E0UGB3_GLOV7|nr:hypothetical protein Cyan7822_4841 [Gloeothece verrucosa PCC 7822]